MSEKNTKASTDNTVRPKELEDNDLDQASGGYYRYELTNVKSDGIKKTGANGKPSPGWGQGDFCGDGDFNN